VKTLDIALKDVRRYYRSPFVLVLMLATPLLITGLLYFAFGGFADGGTGVDLPATRMWVVNLDRPGDVPGAPAAGQMLVDFLQHEDVGGLLEVQMAADEASALAAVGSQRADLALIIPQEFTAAALMPGRQATVMLHQDPALTIGPRIVQTLVRQFVDGFAGAKIAVNVTASQLAGNGIALSPDLAQNVAQQYATWLQSSGHGSETETTPAFQVQLPSGEVASTTPAEGTQIIGRVMSGMMIFFVFFMAANTAESIVREDEEGTLGRLFTTPTPQSTILTGKFTTVFISLAIQLALLLGSSALIFGIDWGMPLTVLLVSLGTIVVAAGFGILLMSFVKSTRQAGPVMGSVLTITGMLGGLFTTGIPDIPEVFDTVSLVTPHGWALEGWEQAVGQAGAGTVIVPVLVMLGMGLAFLVLGVLLFRRRFE
jgi:ABC-2 type transport system permease protein